MNDITKHTTGGFEESPITNWEKKDNYFYESHRLMFTYNYKGVDCMIIVDAEPNKDNSRECDILIKSPEGRFGHSMFISEVGWENKEVLIPTITSDVIKDCKRNGGFKSS